MGDPAPDIDREWFELVVRYMAGEHVEGRPWPYDYEQEVIGDGQRKA